MTYCYTCLDTRESECSACSGKGKIGGFLGIGSKTCAMCSGKGTLTCPECTFSDDAEGMALTQSKLVNVTSTRPAMVPPEPTPIPSDGARTIKDEEWRAREKEASAEVGVVEIVGASNAYEPSVEK